MFPVKKGEVADEARIARSERQFQISQKQYPHDPLGGVGGAAVDWVLGHAPHREQQVLRMGGQQHGLLKLEKGWSPTLSFLDKELMTQIKLDLMREQMAQRFGSATSPYQVDPIPLGVAVAQEQLGLRTPFGAILGTNARVEPVPKYPTPQSTITPRKPKQPTSG